MRAWLRHHHASLAAALRRLARQPVDTLLGTLVIGIALALPLGGYALLASLQTLAGGMSVSAQVSVFLAPEAGPGDREAVDRRLRAMEGVRDLRFIPRQKALEELKARPGVGEVVTALRDNPLPDAFIVSLGDTEAGRAEQLAAAARALPQVAHVQIDSAWAQRLQAMILLARGAIGLLAVLLGVALVAATFNTIRLQILTRRDEIIVSRLVGATDATIRRPFYWFGTLQGALGGGLALGIVWLALRLLDRDVATLAGLYGSDFRLGFVPLADGLSVIAFAGALGWVGAHMSVSKHLHDIEPR